MTPRTPRRSARRTGRRTARLLAALPLLLVALVLGGPSPAGAIVGGSSAPDGSHRFMASLQSLEGDHFCGGSVVARRWILTAAHCSDRAASSARVVVGRTDLSQPGGQVLKVNRIVVHPQWESTGTHDVALWKVDRPITAAPAIRVVGLRDQSYEQDGTRLTVAGWGTEFFGSPTVPDRLKQVDVDVVGDDRCTLNSLAGFQPATEICAAELLGDSCQGDSGGPLFGVDAKGRPVQVGAVSYGLGCATPGFPGVYAELNNPAVHRFLTRTIARG